VKTIRRVAVLLAVARLLTIPASAAELRVVGFIDNVFPRWDMNTSNFDRDVTRTGDELFVGRTRNRTFFNFIASDDLRGVFALEIDATYGAPSQSGGRVGSGCVTGTGPFAFEQCGFRNGIDTNSLELKELYVDFRVPQIPVGNRWRLGGRPLNVTPLRSLYLYHMDNGGGDVTLDFSDQVSALLYYVQLEEDLDRFTGSAKIGEDYIAGTTILLKPIPGLDFHIPFAFYHGQAPFGPALTGGGGPFNDVLGTTNVATEDRYYIGFDARYRLGNTTIEPGFIYLFGERKFTAASAAATGVSKADFDGFQGFLKLTHTTGPWLFSGKFGYVSGNKADEDINNTGRGNRADVGFRPIGIDGSHFFGEWFELLGKSDVDGVFNRSPYRIGEFGGLDQFGLMVLGGHAEYKMTDQLILTGSAGGFWTAEKTGCPAKFRGGTVPETCLGSGAPRTVPRGDGSFNFTGNSRFAGWEVNAGLRYTIIPGLTWTPLIAYADYGDALAINNRKPLDAWALINRMIYIF
jgi:hypothetical protein